MKKWTPVEILIHVIPQITQVAHDLPYSDPARHALNEAHHAVARAIDMLKDDCNQVPTIETEGRAAL